MGVMEAVQQIRVAAAVARQGFMGQVEMEGPVITILQVMAAVAVAVEMAVAQMVAVLQLQISPVALEGTGMVILEAEELPETGA